jgi:L-2-hydroxycarboxylate dehydrogenase (NAD+)
VPTNALGDMRKSAAADQPAWARAVRSEVSRSELTRFATQALQSVGVPLAPARTTASVLVLADARAHPSHGVSRLAQYVRLVESGSVNARPNPHIVGRRVALELWDADHALGPVIGYRVIDGLVRRARRTGIAAAIVRNAGHFGIAGAYVLRAMDQGMLGMPPTGGATPVLGTNPLAIGASDGQGRGFLLDMATSVVAVGKVEVAARRGVPIPQGWALDRHGRPTTDAGRALEGMMLPLGGGQETGGYKGYGLAAAVDLLTGVLGDGAWASGVAGMWDTGTPSTVAQAFLVLDPAAFGSVGSFQARLRSWRGEVTGSPRQVVAEPILMAGEREWEADELQRERVRLDPGIAAGLGRLAADLGLRRQWSRLMRT